MIQIDHERCIRCSLCVRECPVLCFRLNEEGISLRHEEHCLHCGHCVAVCPAAAIALEGSPRAGETIPSDKLPPVRPFIAFEDFDNLAKGRRSVRVFKNNAVPRDTLLRALDCARYAPTAKNLENVSWIVIEGRERLRRISDAVVDVFRPIPSMAGVARSHDAGHDPIFRSAPCAVFACADSGYDLSACNCDIAATYLELALPTLGLGTCWAGFVMRAAIDSPTVRAAIGAPEGQTPFAGLMVGIPDIRYHRIPARRELRVTWMTDE